MTYTRPFVTNRFIAYDGDTRDHTLSLAVRVIDDFTREQAEVRLRVELKELKRSRPFRNQSGEFCFEAIPDGDYTLVVEPDPTTADWFYLQPVPGDDWTESFERPVRLPLPDLRSPLVEVTLSPKTSYPFPNNATLIRGTVTEGAPSVEVAGAIVSTAYEQVDPDDSDQTIVVAVETRTDRKGEYVLFFQSMPGKTEQVFLTAVKDGQQVQRQVEITEGATLKAEPLHLP